MVYQEWCSGVTRLSRLNYTGAALGQARSNRALAFALRSGSVPEHRPAKRAARAWRRRWWSMSARPSARSRRVVQRRSRPDARRRLHRRAHAFSLRADTMAARTPRRRPGWCDQPRPDASSDIDSTRPALSTGLPRVERTRLVESARTSALGRSASTLRSRRRLLPRCAVECRQLGDQLRNRHAELGRCICEHVRGVLVDLDADVGTHRTR